MRTIFSVAAITALYVFILHAGPAIAQKPSHRLLEDEFVGRGKICDAWVTTQPHTKLVAALNVNQGDVYWLRDVLNLGVDVVRLNLSHVKGGPSNAVLAVEKITAAAALTGRPVGILYDLPGTKFRLGTAPLDVPFAPEKKSTITIFEGESVTSENFFMDGSYHLPVPKKTMNALLGTKGEGKLKAGERVLFDDGKMVCEVTWIHGRSIGLKVLSRSEKFKLRDRLGIDFPDTDVIASDLEETDRILILAAILSGGVHKIALSFVRGPHNVLAAKQAIRTFVTRLKTMVGKSAAEILRHREHADLLQEVATVLSPDPIPLEKTAELLADRLNYISLHEPEVDAKFERRDAILRAREIMAVADGAMVARGDLISAVGSQYLIWAQNVVTKESHLANKPVIVATGLAEGVSDGIVPQANASDIARVVESGADAGQLSNESVLRDPFETIPVLRHHLVGGELAALTSPRGAITLDPEIRVVYSEGATLEPGIIDRHVLREVVVLTSDPVAAGILTFQYGVRPIYVPEKAPLNGKRAEWLMQQATSRGYRPESLKVMP